MLCLVVVMTGANGAPPATRGGIFGVSREEDGKQRQFEATLKSCRDCTVKCRLKWGNGKNLSSMNGGKHRDTCDTHPGRVHKSNSTPAVCAPIWLLNEKGERQGDSMTVDEYERLYHPRPL
jgi:hypothetical protein